MQQVLVPGVNGRVKAIRWPRILVGIPCERVIPYADEVRPWYTAIAQRGHPVIHQPYTRTDIACNAFVSKMLEGGATHLLILGLDHIHPDDIVERFIRHLKGHPEHQVIAGLNFRRGEPYDPLAWIYDGDDVYTVDDWSAGEIVKVSAAGSGTMCIAREVFERISPPWFWIDYGAGDWQKGGMSEDMVFCRSCREQGIDIWLDTSIVSDHLTVKRINESTYRAYQAQHPEDYGELLEVDTWQA